MEEARQPQAGNGTVTDHKDAAVTNPPKADGQTAAAGHSNVKWHD